MFGNFFGAKRPASAPAGTPRGRRVNLEKRFAIVAEFGNGSMSHVYRAVDNQTGRSVCLKVQDPEKSAAAGARATRAGRLTEGDLALRIVHPNVVRIFEHGESTKHAHYIVMEFIDGQSLTYLRQSRVLKLADKIGFLAQAADGLAAVHAAGFIHHDFGPKNILVDRDDRLKIIDFGLAVPNTPDFRRPGNRTGTLQYMAPEVIRREPKDERIDIFSFGAMTFEFLTNKLPYDATEPMAMMRQRINGDPIDIEKVAPHLPFALKEIVRGCLTRSAKDRSSSMAKVAAALRDVPVTG